MVKVHESVGRPQNPAQLFAGDNFAGMFQEINQDEEGLLANLDEGSIAAQLHPARVHFIDTETPSLIRADRRGHNLTLEGPVGEV